MTVEKCEAQRVVGEPADRGGGVRRGGRGEANDRGVAWKEKADRIFTGPSEDLLVTCTDGGEAVLQPIPRDGAPAAARTQSHVLELLSAEEALLEVHWQRYHKPGGRGASANFGAVLTTHRLLIVTATLQVVASTEQHVPGHSSDLPAVHSCLWVGPALLYSNGTAISLLAWDSTSHRLCTVDAAGGCALLGALNDRLLYVQRGDRCSGATAQVVVRAVGLLQPLLLAWLSFKEAVEPSLELRDCMSVLIERFDGGRTTVSLLDQLHKAGYPGLALELARFSPQYNRWDVYRWGRRANNLDGALMTLRDEVRRLETEAPGGGGRAGSAGGALQALKMEAREVARECLAAGQLASMLQCLEITNDYPAMVELLLQAGKWRDLTELAPRIPAEFPELRELAAGVLQAQGVAGGAGGGLQNAPRNAAPEWQLCTAAGGQMKIAGGGSANSMSMSTRAQGIPYLDPSETLWYTGARGGGDTHVGRRARHDSMNDDEALHEVDEGAQSDEDEAPGVLGGWMKVKAAAPPYGPGDRTPDDSAAGAAEDDAAANEAEAEFTKRAALAGFSSSSDEEEAPRKPRLKMTIRASADPALRASGEDLRKASSLLSLAPPGGTAPLQPPATLKPPKLDFPGSSLGAITSKQEKQVGAHVADGATPTTSHASAESSPSMQKSPTFTSWKESSEDADSERNDGGPVSPAAAPLQTTPSPSVLASVAAEPFEVSFNSPAPPVPAPLPLPTPEDKSFEPVDNPFESPAVAAAAPQAPMDNPFESPAVAAAAQAPMDNPFDTHGQPLRVPAVAAPQAPVDNPFESPAVAAAAPQAPVDNPFESVEDPFVQPPSSSQEAPEISPFGDPPRPAPLPVASPPQRASGPQVEEDPFTDAPSSFDGGAVSFEDAPSSFSGPASLPHFPPASATSYSGPSSAAAAIIEQGARRAASDLSTAPPPVQGDAQILGSDDPFADDKNREVPPPTADPSSLPSSPAPADSVLATPPTSVSSVPAPAAATASSLPTQSNSSQGMRDSRSSSDAAAGALDLYQSGEHREIRK
ncbi:hypothetical protein CYMTET_43613 [Cymbomonas tetramitiformis]|uniref:Uncharacterized protein n=1 Tax=Cymbomonas tetramitiformis TaxID=36881 RepID=A0AAE0C3W4_9CHLO|nr:hypothetical protein CYMTET_43613 [Cymbomonas tetramitiformis]